MVKPPETVTVTSTSIDVSSEDELDCEFLSDSEDECNVKEIIEAVPVVVVSDSAKIASASSDEEEYDFADTDEEDNVETVESKPIQEDQPKDQEDQPKDQEDQPKEPNPKVGDGDGESSEEEFDFEDTDDES